MRLALVTATVLACSSALTAQTPNWLINEVSTLTDYVEIINCSAAPQSPSGISLWSFETRGNSVPCNPVAAPLGLNLHFTVPAGQPAVPPGGVFVFHESVATPCGVVTGANIFWFEASDLIVWINTDPVNATAGQIDMVCIGDIQQTDQVLGTYDGGGQWVEGPVCRPNAGFDAIYRPSGAGGACPTDTNTSRDWRFASSSESTSCAPNPATFPNPLSFGQGYSATGNCAASANGNTATELPTLTINGASFDMRPGGSFTLAIRTGMTSAPPITCLLFGTRQYPGTPTLLPACVGSVVDYVNPAGAGSICYFSSLTWDPDFAADLPTINIPNQPQLVGASASFQGYVFDLNQGSCPLRNTNALRLQVIP